MRPNATCVDRPEAKPDNDPATTVMRDVDPPTSPPPPPASWRRARLDTPPVDAANDPGTPNEGPAPPRARAPAWRDGLGNGEAAGDGRVARATRVGTWRDVRCSATGVACGVAASEVGGCKRARMASS